MRKASLPFLFWYVSSFLRLVVLFAFSNASIQCEWCNFFRLISLVLQLLPFASSFTNVFIRVFYVSFSLRFFPFPRFLSTHCSHERCTLVCQHSPRERVKTMPPGYGSDGISNKCCLPANVCVSWRSKRAGLQLCGYGDGYRICINTHTLTDTPLASRISALNIWHGGW